MLMLLSLNPLDAVYFLSQIFVKFGYVINSRKIKTLYIAKNMFKKIFSK